MPEIVAQEVTAPDGIDLVPAVPRRDWMDQSPNGFANRCLPMLMANSLGWDVRTTHAYTFEHTDHDSILCTFHDERGRPNLYPMGHFGGGIVTWSVPWLIRTPPGWDLLVMPSANRPLPYGVDVLSGLVESDHTNESFTLNWMLAKGAVVEMRPGDVIATLLPYPTKMLQEMGTRLATGTPPYEYFEWHRSRSEFLANERGPKDWQKGYWRTAKKTRLRLPRFGSH